jgi:sugar phosphate permease
VIPRGCLQRFRVNGNRETVEPCSGPSPRELRRTIGMPQRELNSSMAMVLNRDRSVSCIKRWGAEFGSATIATTSSTKFSIEGFFAWAPAEWAWSLLSWAVHNCVWQTLIGMGFGAALFTGLTALGTRPGLGPLIGVVPALVVIRFLVGACTAPLYPACGRMNANWFPSARQGLVWGLVAGGAGIGSALSPSLFAWMIPRYGWRNSFWLAAAATALLAAVWAWYARDRPSERRSNRDVQDSFPPVVRPQGPGAHRKSGLRKLLTNRNVVLLALGYGTVSYFEYIFFYWIYYYFREIRRMSQSETSTYTTAIFLAWVVMTPLGGWLSDRLIRIFGKKTGRPMVPVGAFFSVRFCCFSVPMFQAHS